MREIINQYKIFGQKSEVDGQRERPIWQNTIKMEFRGVLYVTWIGFILPKTSDVLL